MIIRLKLRNGFTLVEVIVSIIVMSSMMIGMINLVHYGMKTWEAGQSKLNAAAYNRMTYELIKENLLNASNLELAVSNASSGLGLMASVTNRLGSTVHQVKFSIATGSTLETENVLTKTLTSPGGFSLNTVDIDDGTDAGSIYSRHFNMTIARNVMNFHVERPSSYTIEVSLQLGEEGEEDADGDGEYDLQTVSSQTMIFLVPGVN